MYLPLVQVVGDGTASTCTGSKPPCGFRDQRGGSAVTGEHPRYRHFPRRVGLKMLTERPYKMTPLPACD